MEVLVNDDEMEMLEAAALFTEYARVRVQRDNAGRPYVRIRIYIKGDPGPIHRFRDLVGRGSVHYREDKGGAWTYETSGRSTVDSILKRLWPYLPDEKKLAVEREIYAHTGEEPSEEFTGVCQSLPKPTYQCTSSYFGKECDTVTYAHPTAVKSGMVPCPACGHRFAWVEEITALLDREQVERELELLKFKPDGYIPRGKNREKQTA